VEQNRSCDRPSNHIDFSVDDPVIFTIEVTALTAGGEVCTDYNRPARIRVVPGEIENLGLGGLQQELWPKGAIVHLRNGRARTQVAVRKAYGDNVRNLGRGLAAALGVQTFLQRDLLGRGAENPGPGLRDREVLWIEWHRPVQ